MEAERAAAAGATAPGSRGGELSEVLTVPARAPICAHLTPPSPGLSPNPPSDRLFSSRRGVAAGGNHGVRSRYSCTLLFHQVSRRGVGKRRESLGRKGLYLASHLRVLEFCL